MASKINGTLYVGFTNDIFRRTWEHKNRIFKKAFTGRYNVFRLVYYEEHNSMQEALHREKCMKEWKRLWKIRLIESMNPNWEDLSKGFES